VRRSLSTLALVATAAIVAAPARAEEPPAQAVPSPWSWHPTAAPPPPQRRPAAIAVAAVPGPWPRGLGAALAGAPVASRRLFWLSVAGLGALVVGGVPVGVLRGSERVTWIGIPLAVGGAGATLAAWAGDLWVATGAAPATWRAPSEPAWQLEVGAAVLTDPVLADSHTFTTLGAALARGRGRVETGALVAVDGDTQRSRTTLAWRTHRRDGGATWLEVRAHGGVDRFARPTVTTLTGELTVAGRADGHVLAPTLAGLFAELELGAGLELARYQGAAATGPRWDVTDLALGRITLGATWSGPAGGGAGHELALHYDHRRDQLVGGAVAGPADGFFGSVGASVSASLGSRWALRAGVEYGSAWLGSLAVGWRGGRR
jgi:hypothetical protein